MILITLILVEILTNQSTSMKVKHVFDEQMYVISNFGVARNPIFEDEKDIESFIEKANRYLGEVCTIHDYRHQVNQFQYLISIKSRTELEKFFLKKQRSKKKRKNVANNLYDIENDIPPPSYLIFSQEVSNFLNAYVKGYNFRHGRKGGLFASRYSKHLVQNEEEMKRWISFLHGEEELITFESKWKLVEELEMRMEDVRRSSLILHRKDGMQDGMAI